MARAEPDSKDPVVEDVDDAGAGESSGHGGSYVEYVDEDTPLLPTDLPADIVPDKAFQRYVVGMSVLFLVVILATATMMQTPAQQIMEDVICHSTYSDHMLFGPTVVDDRCKEPAIQKTLAMVTSWDTSAQMLVPMLVQIPYGIIADKYGRRLVLVLSIIGLVLQFSWSFAVLLFPNVFSIWALIPGAAFFLIGGSGTMTVAMLYTMVSDAVPAAQRTPVFYGLGAASVVLKVIMMPIVGFLQSRDPWVPMWIGFGGLVLTLLTAAMMPETLKLRQKADDRRHRDEEARGTAPAPSDEVEGWPSKTGVLTNAWRSMHRDTMHIWRYVFAAQGVMPLIVALSVSFPVSLAVVIGLPQYMTKRYGWTWSMATYYMTISSLTSLLTLLVFLPLASRLLNKHTKIGPLARDLYLGRVSAIFIALGILLMALAPTAWLLIAALVVMSLGSGFGAQIRALLSASVEPHMLGALNTSISTVEAFLGLISAPAAGWLLSRGIELGGPWMGLPFLVTTVLAVGVVVVLFVCRVPGGNAQRS